MTDAQRAAEQEKEALAAIESGSIRRNSAPDPDTVVAPPPPSEPAPAMENVASAKMRMQLLSSGMTAQEAEDAVAEFEGRPPRVMPAALSLVPVEAPASLDSIMPWVPFAPITTETKLFKAVPPVDPVEMSDEEWAAARRRVTDARVRVSAAQEAVTAATAELNSAIGELEEAKRAVAAGAAFLTSL